MPARKFLDRFRILVVFRVKAKTSKNNFSSLLIVEDKKEEELPRVREIPLRTVFRRIHDEVDIA